DSCHAGGGVGDVSERTGGDHHRHRGDDIRVLRGPLSSQQLGWATGAAEQGAGVVPVSVLLLSGIEPCGLERWFVLGGVAVAWSSGVHWASAGAGVFIVAGAQNRATAESRRAGSNAVVRLFSG